MKKQGELEEGLVKQQIQQFQYLPKIFKKKMISACRKSIYEFEINRIVSEGEYPILILFLIPIFLLRLFFGSIGSRNHIQRFLKVEGLDLSFLIEGSKGRFTISHWYNTINLDLNRYHLYSIILLAKFKSRISSESLKKVIKKEVESNEDIISRNYAIWSLGYKKEIEAVPIFVNLIKNEAMDKSTRFEAIRSLANFHTIDSIAFLIELLKNRKYKKKAMKSLKIIAKKMNVGNFNDLIGILEKETNERINEATKLREEALKLIKLKQFKDAKNIFVKALSIVSNFPEGLTIANQIRNDLKFIEDTEKVYNLIIKSENLIKNRKFEEAIVELKQALKISPKSVKAIELFQNVNEILLKTRTEEIQLLLRKGKLLLKENKITEAENLLKKAAKLDKKNKLTKKLKADIMEKKKTLEEEKLAAKRKQSIQSQLLTLESSRLLAKDQLEFSLKKFDEALILNPNNIEAKKGKNLVIKKLRNIRIILDFISKFEENIPVNLNRIAELANISENDTKEVIKYILKSQPALGRYLDMEQVFIRAKDTSNLVEDIKTKYYICYYCGSPIDKSDKNCSNCKKDVLHCSVCKLIISFGDEVGKCSLCEAEGHLVHLQEWVKTQGKCPTCMQKIPMEGIVPIKTPNGKK